MHACSTIPRLLTAEVGSLVPRLFPLPVFDHLQYAIGRGKVWEIWSRAVTSGRQRVDTQGVVPNSNNFSNLKVGIR